LRSGLRGKPLAPVAPGSLIFFVPCSAVALDKGYRRRWTTGAGHVRIGRLIASFPCLQDWFYPAPRCLYLIAAHEECLAAAHHVEKEPLIGVWIAYTEGCRETHVQRHVMKAHAAGPWVLDHEPQLDALVGLQPDDQLVRLRGLVCGTENRVRNLPEGDDNFGDAGRKALASP
jgi:hypothetical protein